MESAGVARRNNLFQEVPYHMKTSSEFRAIARRALKGKWQNAFIAALIFGILSSDILDTFLRINISDNDIEYSSSIVQRILNSPLSMQFSTQFAPLIALITSVGLLLSLVRFVVGGPVEMGYRIYNTRLVSGVENSVNDLFSQFKRFADGFISRLLRTLFIFLWALLLVIPGIVKSYAYRMTPYIMNDFPELTPSQCIDFSKKLMNGYKGELFLLELSFLGWGFLTAIPMSVGMFIFMRGTGAGALILAILLIVISNFLGFFVTAYFNAAEAAFYIDRITMYNREQESMNMGGNGSYGGYTGGNVNYDGYPGGNEGYNAGNSGYNAGNSGYTGNGGNNDSGNFTGGGNYTGGNYSGSGNYTGGNYSGNGNYGGDGQQGLGGSNPPDDYTNNPFEK